MSTPMNDVDGLIDYSDNDGNGVPDHLPVATPPATVSAPAPMAADTIAVAPTLNAAPTKEAPVDEDDDEDDEEDKRHPAVYAMRRTFLRTGLVVLIVVAVIFGIKQFGSNDPAPAPQAERGDAVPADQEAASAAAQQSVLPALEAAELWQAQNGTFAGFSYPGARVATSTDVLALSMVIGDMCYYSAVLPGQENVVLQDGTGSACTDDMIAQTQASLDAQVAQAKTDNQEIASADLSDAVESVQFYAMNNFVGGSPSFEGMTSTYVEGVGIASLSPGSVTLQARSGNECLVTTVTYDSASEPVTATCQGS